LPLLKVKGLGCRIKSAEWSILPSGRLHNVGVYRMLCVWGRVFD
jgi:hypothetical protein